MNIENFEEKDYIGDWVTDYNIKIDKDQVLRELEIISYVPEEFCFHIYDAMISATFYEVSKRELFLATGKFLEVEELNKKMVELEKR